MRASDDSLTAGSANWSSKSEWIGLWVRYRKEIRKEAEGKVVRQFNKVAAEVTRITGQCRIKTSVQVRRTAR